MERASYLIKLSRPRFWFYLAGPIVVAVAYAASDPADLITPTTVALFVYFVGPANIYLYGINDLFDTDIDAANPKKGDKEVHYTGQGFVPVIVVASGLALFGLFPLVNRGAWPWLLLYAVLATEYSAPPFRFKTTPFLDSVSNGLYILPGVAAYVTVAGTQPPLTIIVGAWLWAMAMHTFSAIPDIEPDRRAGIDTTATVLGERGAFGYCIAVWAAAAVAFGIQDVRAGIVIGLYAVIATGVLTSEVSVDRAYWWYPYINTGIGAGLTLWALIHAVPPSAVLPPAFG